MQKPPTPPNEESGYTPLLKALFIILQKLNEQILLFVIGVFIIALIAYVIGGLDFVIQLRIFFIVLASVGIIAVVVSRFFSRTTMLGGTGGAWMTDNSTDDIRFLTKWVDTLTRIEFERMIHELLPPQEEARLSKPVNIIDSSTFLNDFRFFRGRLGNVESYLQENYSTRRP